MITTSYGYKKPENGEKGAPVFSALNTNTQLVNDHTHNGTNSAQISSTDISKPSVNLPTGSWVAGSTGFSQTVTCPGSVTLDVVNMRFRIRTGALAHTFIYPTVVANSLTQFVVTVNDNSLDLECLFI